MSLRTRGLRGFTLIELMIVVAIIGILAAIMVPAFLSYTRRAKTSEATNNLKGLYTGAANYYQGHRVGQGIVTMGVGGCTVRMGGPLPAVIGGNKQTFDFTADPAFGDLGFQTADPIYFAYGIDSIGELCGGGANRVLYTFYAQGDLDGDGMRSQFELAVGTNNNDGIYRAAGFYILDDSE